MNISRPLFEQRVNFHQSYTTGKTYMMVEQVDDEVKLPQEPHAPPKQVTQYTSVETLGPPQE